MFNIIAINLPAGKTAAIQCLAPTPSAKKIGDQFGPQGAQYVITIQGMGSFSLVDIGNSVSGPATWAVRINNAVNWFYEGGGQLSLTVDAGGNVTASGGANTVTTKINTESGSVLSDLSAPQYGYDMVVGTTL
jgi:hypothetical protein